MRWHPRLCSLQNAASSITWGALDIQRATGLKNMPDLTEKNAINTFLLFSLSLSPDLFMFLELCLHCLAFIRGDVGCCSTRLNGVLMYSHIRKGTRRCGRSSCFCGRPDDNIFCLKALFVQTLLEETLKAQRGELQIPQQTRSRGGSSFSAR